MLSDTEIVYRPAVRCCASLMVSSEPSIIDQAFMEGIVDAFFKNLFRNQNEVVKEALWGLSNVCCGTDKQIAYVLSNDDLVTRVIDLMRHNLVRIMSEATYVITNALTTCSDETLRDFSVKYFDVLAEPLANVLNRLEVIEQVGLI